MKFSASSLLVILPLLAAQASALTVPDSILVARAGGQGKGKGAAAAGGAAGGGAAAANATGAAATAANTTGAAATGAAAAGGDPQTSLTLDPKVIGAGINQDGNQVPVAGQSPSATSTNNFINACLLSNSPITNGKQVKTGSCNPIPMGVLPASTSQPASKFLFPMNTQDIGAPNTAFTIQMKLINIETGVFTNAQKNYFAAPQNVNAQGQIVGHTHCVIQKLASLTDTTVLDPQTFEFFQGINIAAVNGVVTATVTKGLPAGFYKLASINTAANHQPVVGPVAQHGPHDDQVYFTVGGGGAGAAGAGAAAAGTGAAGAGAGAAANTTATAAVAGAANSTAAAANSPATGGAAAGAAAGGGGKGGKGKGGKRSARFIREYY